MEQWGGSVGVRRERKSKKDTKTVDCRERRNEKGEGIKFKFKHFIP